MEAEIIAVEMPAKNQTQKASCAPEGVRKALETV